MAFRTEDIEANRRYFEEKLRAVKQKADVVHKVQDGVGDLLLLDTRARQAFAKEHIEGAWCAPLEELEVLAPHLPRNMELVTYCWTDT